MKLSNVSDETLKATTIEIMKSTINMSHLKTDPDDDFGMFDNFLISSLRACAFSSCPKSSFSASAFSCRSLMTRSFLAAFLVTLICSFNACSSSSFLINSSFSFRFCSTWIFAKSSHMKGTISFAAFWQSFNVRHLPTTFSSEGWSGLPFKSRYRNFVNRPNWTGRFSSWLLYRSRCFRLTRWQKSSVRNFSWFLLKSSRTMWVRLVPKFF